MPPKNRVNEREMRAYTGILARSLSTGAWLQILSSSRSTVSNVGMDWQIRRERLFSRVRRWRSYRVDMMRRVCVTAPNTGE